MGLAAYAFGVLAFTAFFGASLLFNQKGEKGVLDLENIPGYPFSYRVRSCTME